MFDSSAMHLPAPTNDTCHKSLLFIRLLSTRHRLSKLAPLKVKDLATHLGINEPDEKEALMVKIVQRRVATKQAQEQKFMEAIQKFVESTSPPARNVALLDGRRNSIRCRQP